MEPNRESLEPLVRQILSEVLAESAPAGAPGVSPAAGHPVEVRMEPDGTLVVRRGHQAAPAPELLAASLVDPECICCTVSPACICDRCICSTCVPGASALGGVTLAAETETVVGKILEAEPMSRDQLMDRLWERALARLVHEEAVSFHQELSGGGDSEA